MPSIVYVHGIANRGRNYDETFALISKEVRRRRADVTMVECNWGVPLGARLPSEPKSLPSQSPSKSRPIDPSVAIWGLLEVEPLAEIEELSQSQFPAPLSAARSIDAALKEGLASGALESHLRLLGITSDEFARALSKLEPAASFRAALDVKSSVGEIDSIVVRACISMALVLQREVRFDCLPGFQFRQEVCDRIIAQIAPKEKAFGAIPLNVAKIIGTSLLRWNRGSIMQTLIPFVGDVTFYQANGAAIRDYIRGCIDKSPPPVYLLGHSLGGIGCVELLISHYIPTVKGLITVGSQSPLLYEYGALQTLRRGKGLPLHFPRWLSIYDPNDLLSFLAAPVFASATSDVVDKEVHGSQMFPDAHGAYWDLPEVWDEVISRID